MTDDLTSSYYFELPPDLIAREPAAQRDASRLLVLDRETGRVEHRTFSDLPSLLQPSDLLVVNRTQVVPARLKGFRTKTGGKWEGLFLREEPDGNWRIIGQTRGSLQPGETITLVKPDRNEGDQHCELRLLDRGSGGEWIASPPAGQATLDVLHRFGSMPLPPYMERDAQPVDQERYQTVYASTPGAVAAPTAGLHFTPGIFSALEVRGVGVASVTLHVGLGTFRPMSVERLSEHVMHAEWYELPPETVERIESTKARGGRVIAVGTTTVRTLESAAQSGQLIAGSGETDIFIRPGHQFQVVDQLITNFHLPQSTLLVLVSAFASRPQILSAYAQAIEQRYRFYSYGDAMLIQ